MPKACPFLRKEKQETAEGRMLTTFSVHAFDPMFRPRKYPYSPHRRDWNFLGGGGFYKAKKFKDTVCMKLNWNFKRVGVLEKNPFHRRGIDIFWNYTISERQNSLW